MTLSLIDQSLQRPITPEEAYWVVKQFYANLSQSEEQKKYLDEQSFDRDTVGTTLKIINLTLDPEEQRKLIVYLKTISSDQIPTKEIDIKNEELAHIPKEKSIENVAEKEREIDTRIVITQTRDGFTTLDATNLKNEGAGATYDVRPVNDPSRYHFYNDATEVRRKWNKDDAPFTFTYTRDGKKYLYATAGLNAFSGKSEGGRYGNIFVSIELTEDLPNWTEEYVLKKAIDIANEKFGKDFKVPIEFKKEYLSNLISS